jgi:hypothetical protein
MTRVSERWYVEHMGGTYPDQYVYIGGTSVYECGSNSTYCVGQIDVCHRTEEARREAYRKANLAAAAPEMKAALNAARDLILRVANHDAPEVVRVLNAIDSAILKSTGGAK